MKIFVNKRHRDDVTSMRKGPKSRGHVRIDYIKDYYLDFLKNLRRLVAEAREQIWHPYSNVQT